jgi:ParB family chromosome partitioning protein
MQIMAIDLSALDGAVAVRGEPLQLALTDVDEDPDQPRKKFDPEDMAGMVASIKFRGVKSPVSVRTHPTKRGRWILNYGARRYRASVEAGRTTIPAFIDESHEDYDQVIENLQRSDLTAMELALFIGKKLAAGERKNAIAKKLGKDSSAITHHIALIDAPACIEDTYGSGRCTSAKILYDLRALYEKHPEAVAAWCASESEITRKTVSALTEVLNGGNASKTSCVVVEGMASARPGVRHDVHQPPDVEEAAQHGRESNAEPSTIAFPVPGDAESHKAEGKAKRDRDPAQIKSPLLSVEVEGRRAMVLLMRLPSAHGLLRIKHEDDGSECEVEAGLCRVTALTDSTH